MVNVPEFVGSSVNFFNSCSVHHTELLGPCEMVQSPQNTQPESMTLRLIFHPSNVRQNIKRGRHDCFQYRDLRNPS